MPPKPFIAAMMEQGQSMAPPAPANGGEPGQPEPPMINPQSANKDGSVVFVSPDLFEEKPKKGEEIRLVCRVSNIGDKIGLTPLRIEDINSEELDDLQ